MSVFVVDASVVIKWFVPEVNSNAAGRWLDAPHDYVAPDLLFAEIGNVVSKKVHRQELDGGEARELAVQLDEVPIEIVSTRNLLQDALALALTAGITVYDAMYLTLAVRLDTAVITADQKLANSLIEHPLLAPHVRSVTDFVG